MRLQIEWTVIAALAAGGDTRLVPQHGPEESEASHTEAENLGFHSPETLSHLLPGERVG